MSNLPKDPGFVVQGTNWVYRHQGIKSDTLQKIIDALAIEWPKIERHRDITSIYINNFPDAAKPPSDGK